MRVRLQDKLKPDNYTESCGINVADRWRERNVWYPGRSAWNALKRVTVARGWLNYYGIASMKNNLEDINGWLYHRIRMCIWKQWKLPRTKKRNLIKLGIPEYYADMAANSRKGYWRTSNTTTVKRALTKERLINNGFYDLAMAYQSLHVNY